MTLDLSRGSIVVATATLAVRASGRLYMSPVCGQVGQLSTAYPQMWINSLGSYPQFIHISKKGINLG